MRTICLLLVALFNSPARAQIAHQDVKEYVRAAYGSDWSFVSSADHSPNHGHRVYGVALSADSKNRKGEVFVLSRNEQGALSLEAHSARFDFSSPGDRTYVEFVDDEGPDRFYIQINSRMACGPAVDIYRFKLINAAWRLTGTDSSTMGCEDDFIDLATKYSANFVTGRMIREKYVGGTVTSSKVGNRQFPVFPLATFAPFESAHGAFEE